jgi:hypothetical protein
MADFTKAVQTTLMADLQSIMQDILNRLQVLDHGSWSIPKVLRQNKKPEKENFSSNPAREENS